MTRGANPHSAQNLRRVSNAGEPGVMRKIIENVHSDSEI
jgi:hypothetical protein